MAEKRKLKGRLEKERDELLMELTDIGKLNPETGEWEAVPEEAPANESDSNDQADRFEEFESRSAMVRTLSARLSDIIWALESLETDDYGKCKVCKKEIEAARIEVNPAARTCKKHLEE